MKTAEKNIGPERLTYAALMRWGGRAAIVIMLLTGVLYLLPVSAPYVPAAEMQDYWHLKARQYVDTVHTPYGWASLQHLSHGDEMVFLGILLLGCLTPAGFCILILAYRSQRDFLYMAIALLQFCILLLAASGLLVQGH